MADELEKTRQELKYREELAKLDKDSADYLDNVIKLNRKYVAQRGEALNIEKQLADLSGTQLDKAKAAADHAEREIVALIRRINAGKEVNADLDEQLGKLQQIRDEQDRIREAQSATKRLAGDIATKLGLASNAQSGFLRSALSADKPMAALRDNFKALGGNLAKTFTAANIGVSIATKLIKTFASTTKDAVVEADKLRSEFVALTGDTSSARDAFINLTLSNTDLAIGFKEMMSAQVALRAGFVDLVFLSDAARDSLTLQTATLEKLGVDAGTTSEVINTLTQSFGLTHTQAIQMQRDMVGLGTALGIPPKTITQEFNKALPALAEFGDQATEVFERLVMASRETGLSIDQLTGAFGDAMNTYEGSTKAAGRLNAVLGSGIISGTELLMADTEERFRIVQRSLEMTGKSFEDLGRYERITIAQAAGFRNADEAARAFSNTQEDIATRIGDTTVTQAEMDEMARQATDSFTQLKFAMMSFAVAVKPITEAFAAMVDKFIEFSAGFPGGTAGLVTAITAAAGAITMLIPGGQLIGAGMLATAATAGAGLATAPPVGDALVKGDKITPINSKDDILLARPDGPVAEAMGAMSATPAPNAAAFAAIAARAGQEAAANMRAAQPAAAPTPPARGDGTPLVVKVMINDRELGQAIIPHIDRRVLGTR